MSGAIGTEKSWGIASYASLQSLDPPLCPYSIPLLTPLASINDLPNAIVNQVSAYTGVPDSSIQVCEPGVRTNRFGNLS